jgi:hypothetical protein
MEAQMRERERPRTNRDPGDHEPPAGGPADGGDIDRLRGDADQLLDAAERAIARALSGDSEAFLQANRQRGGQ